MQWTSSPGCGLHAKLLEDAGIENYGHCQGRVTKRTRTVAGDKEAWLFAWDTLERQISASKGCYKVLKRAPAKGTLFQLLVHGEMVLLGRIELPTSPLPRVRSTTELQQQLFSGWAKPPGRRALLG